MPTALAATIKAMAPLVCPMLHPVVLLPLQQRLPLLVVLLLLLLLVVLLHQPGRRCRHRCCSQSCHRSVSATRAIGSATVPLLAPGAGVVETWWAPSHQTTALHQAVAVAVVAVGAAMSPSPSGWVVMEAVELQRLRRLLRRLTRDCEKTRTRS